MQRHHQRSRGARRRRAIARTRARGRATSTGPGGEHRPFLVGDGQPEQDAGPGRAVVERTQDSARRTRAAPRISSGCPVFRAGKISGLATHSSNVSRQATVGRAVGAHTRAQPQSQGAGRGQARRTALARKMAFSPPCHSVVDQHERGADDQRPAVGGRQLAESGPRAPRRARRPRGGPRLCQSPQLPGRMREPRHDEQREGRQRHREHLLARRDRARTASGGGGVCRGARASRSIDRSRTAVPLTPIVQAVATLYRCNTPTDWLCPCGRVARALRRTAIAFEAVVVGQRRSRRPEVEALSGQRRVPGARARRRGDLRLTPDRRAPRVPAVSRPAELTRTPRVGGAATPRSVTSAVTSARRRDVERRVAARRPGQAQLQRLARATSPTARTSSSERSSTTMSAPTAAAGSIVVHGPATTKGICAAAAARAWE